MKALVLAMVLVAVGCAEANNGRAAGDERPSYTRSDIVAARAALRESPCGDVGEGEHCGIIVVTNNGRGDYWRAVVLGPDGKLNYLESWEDDEQFGILIVPGMRVRWTGTDELVNDGEIHVLP